MNQGQPMPFPKYNLNELALYQAVFFHTGNLAYVLDKDGYLLDCNQNFLDLLGLSTMPNKKYFDFYQAMKIPARFSETESIKDIEAADKASLSGRAIPGEQHEQSLIGHDGTIARYQVERIPLYDRHKKIFALLVLLKDATIEQKLNTQIKNIEQELHKYQASNQPPPVPAASFNQAQKPIRILVIEDNKTAQFAAQRVLMQIDCQVDVIDSEAQLLSTFEHGKYDLVLMDIGLEKTNGLFLSKIIRKQERNTQHQVPIVLLTSYETEKLGDECRYYQLNGALAKPLTLENARQLIRHFIFDINAPVTGLKHSA